MKRPGIAWRICLGSWIGILTMGLLTVSMAAQGTAPQTPAPPQPLCKDPNPFSNGETACPVTATAPAVVSAKAAGGIDLTGYWVSVIVDDVRFYTTPQKGDVFYLPLNDEAKRIANAWDPDKDIADGNQCRAYGAVGVMQQPGRLHITWADDNTLRIDADAGTQTRLLHFGSAPSAPAAPSLQGYSVARWEAGGRGGRGGGGGGRGGGMAAPNSLTVVTRSMTNGYIRKNGIPYSSNAILTEYFNVIAVAPGQAYMTDLASVDDPQYLTEPYYKTHIFKKVPDASGWDPTPCWPK